MAVATTQRSDQFADLLRKSGHKATPRRLSLLDVLAKSDSPLSTQEIVDEVRGRVDQATVYRALEALRVAGIVRRVNMEHAHAHYELTSQEDHHHHLICKLCGRVEDIEHCAADTITRTVLSRAKYFSSIESHALEFFGTCKHCSLKNKT